MSPSSPDPACPIDAGDIQRERTDQSEPPRLVGLRATRYVRHDTHPDTRDGPPWCWVQRDPTLHKHEISPDHPVRALHHIEDPIAIVASLYPGTTGESGGSHVQTATIECDLTELGGADPTIEVCLRHWPEGRAVHEQTLALTVEDARELATVLTYLADLTAAPVSMGQFRS